jgi:ABC-2 type transport system ATP-binding protein
VEKIAHRVGIIRQGTLVEVATITQLKQLALKHVDLSLASPSEAKAFAGKLPTQLVKNVTVEGSRARFLAPREAFAHFLPQLNGAALSDINIRDSTLEDIFLEYYDTEANSKLQNNNGETKTRGWAEKFKRRLSN